jgi:radical SAM protein with 4Fe4S-binding SPASM domain
MKLWAKRTHCSGGHCSFVITPDGKVVLCDTIPQTDPFIVDDISNQSVMNI